MSSRGSKKGLVAGEMTLKVKKQLGHLSLMFRSNMAGGENSHMLPN